MQVKHEDPVEKRMVNIRKWRTIIIVVAERKDRLSLLLYYLGILVKRQIVNEIHLWNYAKSLPDSTYIDSLNPLFFHSSGPASYSLVFSKEQNCAFESMQGSESTKMTEISFKVASYDSISLLFYTSKNEKYLLKISSAVSIQSSFFQLLTDNGLGHKKDIPISLSPFPQFTKVSLSKTAGGLRLRIEFESNINVANSLENSAKGCRTLHSIINKFSSRTFISFSCRETL